MQASGVFPLTIYYEDTDFSGVVYHANYLKYFERAREELLGVERLVALYRDRGLGFVVYRVEMTFREGAVHGDRLEVRTTVRLESDYRLAFDQSVWRVGGTKPLVQGIVQLVVIDGSKELTALPKDIVEALKSG